MRQFIDLAFSRRLELAIAHAGQSAAEAAARQTSTFQYASAGMAGGIAIFGGKDSPATQAVGMGLDGSVSSQELDQLEEFFTSRGAPISLKLSPFIDMSLLEEIGKRPYRLKELSNVLHADVNPPPDRMLSPGLAVRRAGKEEAELWTKLLASGYGGQPLVQSAQINSLGGLFDRTDAHCFIAFVDGQPAGGGGLWENDGICCFWGASTLPMFRRRGVQTALIAARMAWATEHFCTSAIAITRPGSDAQRNMERFGLRSVYSRTTVVRSSSE